MKRKYLLLALVILLTLGSCKKYLDPAPTDFLNPRNYFTTETELLYARSSAYSPLAGKSNYENYLIPVEADGGYMNRASLTTGPWNYFYGTSDIYNAAYWKNIYDGINRVNVLLANVDNNKSIPQSKRDIIRGEMLFLRGYYYFTLVQAYGGVPLKLEPTTSVVEVDIPRSTVKEVYDQILKDMTAAEPLVNDIVKLGYGGAVSKSAVRGMLARVNLFMGGEPLNDKTRFAEARKWAKMVIDDAEAGHMLNASYPQIFINLAADKYEIKESIWEVEIYGNNLNPLAPYEAGNNGERNGIASSNALTGIAGAYMNITSKFWNVYEPGDDRKWWNIAHISYVGNPAPAGTKNMTSLPTSESLKNNRNAGKWRREFEVVAKNGAATPINYVLLRYSDVLLMFAEAENEISGPTSAAIDAVNQVRRRAWSTGVNTITITNGGTGYTSAPTVTFSGPVGSTATATGTAVIKSGKVTAINLNRDLSGIKFFQDGEYSSAPTITITGGGGSGASATATIFSKSDADLSGAKIASKQSFLEAIQDERFREFGFEGLRKGDLLRWGIFLQVMQDVGNQLTADAPGAFYLKYYTNVTPRDLLMPIPTTETITNQAIIQNPGWN